VRGRKERRLDDNNDKRERRGYARKREEESWQL
jgi:hypothetical protein